MIPDDWTLDELVRQVRDGKTTYRCFLFRTMRADPGPWIAVANGEGETPQQALDRAVEDTKGAFDERPHLQPVERYKGFPIPQRSGSAVSPGGGTIVG